MPGRTADESETMGRAYRKGGSASTVEVSVGRQTRGQSTAPGCDMTSLHRVSKMPAYYFWDSIHCEVALQTLGSGRSVFAAAGVLCKQRALLFIASLFIKSDRTHSLDRMFLSLLVEGQDALNLVPDMKGSPTSKVIMLRPTSPPTYLAHHLSTFDIPLSYPTSHALRMSLSKTEKKTTTQDASKNRGVLTR